MWTVIGWTAFFSALSLGMVYGLGACAKSTILFGQVQGAMNSVLTIFQWWPQILLTLLLKAQGSLSLPMLFTIQVSDALSIYYLLSLGQDWSVWVSSAVDLTMVTSLIGIVIYFEYLYRRKGKRSEAGGGASDAGRSADAPVEHAALLGDDASVASAPAPARPDATEREAATTLSVAPAGKSNDIL